MTHPEFVAAHREGRLAVHIDPNKAARLVSSRMMLPLILLPVMGLGVALALTGYLITGSVLFVAALAFRYAVRKSSPGFVLRHALEDPVFYEQLVVADVLKIK